MDDVDVTFKPYSIYLTIYRQHEFKANIWRISRTYTHTILLYNNNISICIYVYHGILEYAMVLTISNFFSILLYFDISGKNIKFKSFSFLQENNQLTKGASTRSYTRLFYLVLLYVYDLLRIVHVQKYVCVYEYDVLQPCWIFVRRTRVRRTNVRASFL